jgi:hypothetical protein
MVYMVREQCDTPRIAWFNLIYADTVLIPHGHLVNHPSCIQCLPIPHRLQSSALELPSPAFISPQPSRLLRDGTASPAMSMSIYSKESEDDGPYSGMRDKEDRPGQANVTPLEASVARAEDEGA